MKWKCDRGDVIGHGCNHHDTDYDVGSVRSSVLAYENLPTRNHYDEIGCWTKRITPPQHRYLK